jgi:hypothetical protein
MVSFFELDMIVSVTGLIFFSLATLIGSAFMCYCRHDLDEERKLLIANQIQKVKYCQLRQKMFLLDVFTYFLVTLIYIILTCYQLTEVHNTKVLDDVNLRSVLIVFIGVIICIRVGDLLILKDCYVESNKKILYGFVFSSWSLIFISSFIFSSKDQQIGRYILFGLGYLSSGPSFYLGYLKEKKSLLEKIYYLNFVCSSNLYYAFFLSLIIPSIWIDKLTLNILFCLLNMFTRLSTTLLSTMIISSKNDDDPQQSETIPILTYSQYHGSQQNNMRLILSYRRLM